VCEGEDKYRGKIHINIFPLNTSFSFIYISSPTHIYTKRYLRERNKTEREGGERREEREDAETFMCTHICAVDPLISSRYPPAKRQEFTAGVPSAKFRALIAEERAKEMRCAPAERLKFTAGVPLILRGSAWVSTSSPWAKVNVSCLAKIGA
jgi:hypothetical protein